MIVLYIYILCVSVSEWRQGLQVSWGMLGDFNNTEAVQGDLIKGDDVITEPWL